MLRVIDLPSDSRGRRASLVGCWIPGDGVHASRVVRGRSVVCWVRFVDFKAILARPGFSNEAL